MHVKQKPHGISPWGCAYERRKKGEKMGVSKKIGQMIRHEKLLAAETLSSEQLFNDYACRRFWETKVSEILKKHALEPVEIRLRGSSSYVAYTEGSNIYLTTENSIVDGFPSLSEKFRAETGILFHEVGHCCYLDFEGHERIFGEVKDGLLAKPSDLTKEEEASYNEITEGMKSSPNMRKLIIFLIHNIGNIIADQHDENSLMRDHGAFVEECVMTARKAMLYDQLSYDKMVSKGFDSITMLTNMLLVYCRFGTVIVIDPSLKETELYQVFLKLKPVADQAVKTDSTAVKQLCYSKLLILMYPVIKEEMNDLLDKKKKLSEALKGSASASPSSSGAESKESSDSSGASEAGSKDDSSSGGSSSKDGSPDAGSSKGSSSASGETGAEESSSKGGSSAGGETGAEESSSKGGSSAGGETGTEESSSKGGSSAGGETGAEESSSKGGSSAGGETGTEEGSSKGGASAGGETGAEEGSSKGSSFAGDGSAEEEALSEEEIEDFFKKVLESLEHEAERVSGDSMPEGRESSDRKNLEERGEAEEKSDSAADEILNSLKEQTAASIAEDMVRKRLLDNSQKMAQGIDLERIHAGMKIKCVDENAIMKIRGLSSAKEAYEAEFRALKPYSKRLNRQMKSVLEDISTPSWERHKGCGSDIEFGEVYRHDRKFFEKKSMPKDEPDMVIAVLVDESGSMDIGDRYVYARKAAMILYEFADAINIPINISGHDEDSRVNIYDYVPFDVVNKNAKYSLTDIQARYNNRDGLAINVVADRLARRPEAVKLMIVISDGVPYANNYYGVPAVRDMQSVLKAYRAKGMTILGAAIGDDKEVIEEIYGKKDFLDIGDLRSLPKALTEIVRKYVLKAVE